MPRTPPLRFDPIHEAAAQWSARSWDASEWMAAATSIMRAQQMVLREVDLALKPFGLTFARYESLVLLYFSRERRLPLGKIGDRLMVHPASVTNAINQLESAGLVRRVQHPSDRRMTLAEITKEGVRVVERATKVVTRTKFGLDTLDHAEVRRLTAVITSLRSRSGDFAPPANGRRPPRAPVLPGRKT